MYLFVIHISSFMKYLLSHFRTVLSFIIVNFIVELCEFLIHSGYNSFVGFVC